MSTATARLEFRVSPQGKRRIERAAELAGEQVSSFARAAAEEKADRVLREYEAATTVPAEFFDDLIAAFDVPAVLSGHTHGGQIVLPGFGALARRNFPVLAGLATRDNTSLFVSRGVGTVYVPARINCPPEVALVTLRRQSRI